MKIFTSVIFSLFVFASYGQNQLSKDSVTTFKLTFSAYNSGEAIFNGTATYELTEDSVKVKKRYWGDSSSKVVYAVPVPAETDIVSAIYRIGLDSLKNGYINFCVLPTSGNKYTLVLINTSGRKQIYLHHYYLKQIDDVVLLINSYLPESYQLRYLEKETKQDCKP